MSSRPKIRHLSETIDKFNTGCVFYQQALAAFNEGKLPEYEKALLRIPSFIVGALEWTLKIYLRDVCRGTADYPQLRQPTFHTLLVLMEKYAQPALEAGVIRELEGYREMRNAAEHEATLPSTQDLSQAIETTHQIMLAYLPIKGDQLQLVSSTPSTISSGSHGKTKRTKMEFFTEIGERVQVLFESVRRSTSQTSAYVSFSPGQVENGDKLGSTFQKGQHYFQVRINEMFLAYSREWFSEFDPVVFATTEFLYDRETKMVPQVIGPNLLEQYQRTLPDGVRYINTPVSGLHPYVGSDVVLLVILYRAKREDYLRNLLNIVEKVVGVFDPSTALQSYLAISSVVLAGLEAILGGDDKTEPVVAVRHNIGVGDRFKPGYYALINAPETDIDRERLWVRDNRLCRGDSLKTAEPYREHDFVLFNIVQTEEREDVQKLPFFPLWRETQGLATRPNLWSEAKVSFSALWRELLFSPDLTRGQKEKLKDAFTQELKRLRDEARELEEMAVVRGEQKELPDVEVEFRELDEMLQALD